MKLYELAQNYQNLLDLLDDETIGQEQITAALDGVEGQFDLKAENIVKLMKSIDADTKGLRDEEKRLATRRKTLENRSANLKTYLSDNMKAIGKEKIKGSIFTLAFQKCPPSVNVTDISLIPIEYFIAQEPTLDKKLLLNNLKADEIVAGVEIKQEKTLRIR